MSRTLVTIFLVIHSLGELFFVLRPDPTDPDDAPPAESTTDEPRERVYDVAIQGDTMSSSEIDIEEGDQVTLRLTSDRPLEVHVHGYDLEKEV